MTLLSNPAISATFAVLSAIVALDAKASDTDCLASVMYAESRGQVLDGVVGVGEATVNRAQRTGKTVCNVIGVKRKTPDRSVIAYYKALAAEILRTKSETVVHKADSWNTGDKPRQPGSVTRKIDDHIFYVLKAEAE